MIHDSWYGEIHANNDVQDESDVSKIPPFYFMCSIKVDIFVDINAAKRVHIRIFEPDGP